MIKFQNLTTQMNMFNNIFLQNILKVSLFFNIKMNKLEKSKRFIENKYFISVKNNINLNKWCFDYYTV